jgi:IS30 family transposase
MPFKIKSIQVDSGSEFMKCFEKICQALGIELYVLPPSRPQYNHGVEPRNRTFREGFYATNIPADSVGEFKYHLRQSGVKI